MTNVATASPAAAAGRPSKAAIRERNRLEYDDAADPYWRLTVYDACHDGWWFASIGGRHVLDALVRRAALGPGSQVLEVCSGLGDTCRYLAATTGCRVTGVEWNRRQVEQARRRLRALDPLTAARVRFLRADVLAWTPDRRYDAAVAIDSLMLLEDRRGALGTLGAALAPGGTLVVADVLAGERISERVRELVWQEDGILDLPSPAGHVAMLAAAGFTDAEATDLTPLAAACFTAVVRASERHRAALVAAKGEARYASWLHNVRFYRDAFVERALVYSQVAARAGAAGSGK